MLKTIGRSWLRAARPLLLFYLLLLLVAFVGRLVLIGRYHEPLVAGGVNYWFALLVGLRLDTIAAAAALALPTLFLFLSPPRFTRVSARLCGWYFLVITLITIYMEIATPPFFAEFEARPNELFVNYLLYPREVLSTIFSTQLLPLTLAAVCLSLFTWLYRRWRKQSRLFRRALEVDYRLRLFLFLPTALIIFLGIRSSFGHRPANLSDATFSNSHIANEIAKNTLHAVGYSLYAKHKFSVDTKLYGRMQDDEAIARVQKLLAIDPGKPVHPDYPFLRRAQSHFPRSERPRNLVVIIEESLGAQYVEALGGRPGITPELNRLAQEGILFTQLYASGTRSVRGMEAIVAGFPPIPGTSVLKRNLSQQDFFSLAQALNPKGYHSSFIYGGEKRFDNMGSWYYGNGFQKIIDEPLFENPVYHGIWGVCDEDLVVRADQEFTRHHQAGQPFLSVLFTTTNHTPFEYPEGRISPLPGSQPDSEENAVKFADFALGKFFALAREHGYYENTVFVVVADHNVRVRSSPNGIMPVDNYRIFGLILGGNVEPRRCERLVSQMDVTATALDLLGLDLESPIVGNSIFNPEKVDFALMQFYSLYGFYRGERLAVFEPRSAPRTFRVKGRELLPLPPDEELERDGLALLTASSWLYHQRRHGLPPTEHKP